MQTWEKKFAIFNQGVLKIYNDKHDTEPFHILSLTMTSNLIRVYDVAESNDSTFDRNTNIDYDHMFKIEVYNSNTGWITLFLYIIVSSVSEKLHWISILKEFLKYHESTRSQNIEDYKAITYNFEKDKLINVNCIYQISQNVKSRFNTAIIKVFFIYYI